MIEYVSKHIVYHAVLYCNNSPRLATTTIGCNHSPWIVDYGCYRDPPSLSTISCQHDTGSLIQSRSVEVGDPDEVMMIRLKTGGDKGGGGLCVSLNDG